MGQKSLLIATVLFAGLLVFIAWSANTAQNFFFFRWVHSVPAGDKLAHFFLIGTRTLLINLTLRNHRVRIGLRDWLLGSLIVFTLITIEEVSQAFVPRRTFDLIDLLAN